MNYIFDICLCFLIAIFLNILLFLPFFISMFLVLLDKKRENKVKIILHYRNKEID